MSLAANRELALKVSRVVIRRNIVARIRFARRPGIMLPAFDQGEAKPYAYLVVFIGGKKLKNEWKYVLFCQPLNVWAIICVQPSYITAGEI